MEPSEGSVPGPLLQGPSVEISPHEPTELLLGGSGVAHVPWEESWAAQEQAQHQQGQVGGGAQKAAQNHARPGVALKGIRQNPESSAKAGPLQHPLLKMAVESLSEQ